MIQDIAPRKYDVTYKNIVAESQDYALLFEAEKILMKQPQGEENAAEFLTFDELEQIGIGENLKETAIYLFAIDDSKYFLVNQSAEKVLRNSEKLSKIIENAVVADTVVTDVLTGMELSFQGAVAFRIFEEKWVGFACITALQIKRWLSNRQYCGRCGKPLKHSKTERAMVCDQCNITEYPKISPAVIVGIVDGDKLLLTRYADRPFKRYGLIAGFGEVGETLEDTVHREVMEEVGLKVKELTYYKNQPWSFSDSLLVGFFAKLDGDNTVTLDDGELAEGTWFEKADLPTSNEEIALTAEMIRYFAAGNVNFTVVRH